MASVKHPSQQQQPKPSDDHISFGVWIYLDDKYVRQVAYDLETVEEARAIAARCTGDAKVVRFTFWD